MVRKIGKIHLLHFTSFINEVLKVKGFFSPAENRVVSVEKLLQILNDKHFLRSTKNDS